MPYRPILARATPALTLAAALLLQACRAPEHPQRIAAALNGPGVTVFAAGDIAACGRKPPEQSGAAGTARLIEAGIAQDPRTVVLSLGDNTYPVGAWEEYRGCFDATWGRFKDRIRPVPGNHEYNTPAAVGYFRYFADRPWAGGPDAWRRGYYSFEIGRWHAVALNSNLRGADFRAQLDWLRADLASHPARCTLAYWHHPLFSSGGHGDNEEMHAVWAALEAAGADLVLSAHDHDYERFAPQTAAGVRDDARGIRSFVVGTGGAHNTPMRLRKWNTEVVDNGTLGVLRLTLRDDGYEWEFQPSTPGGITDSGAARCH